MTQDELKAANSIYIDKQLIKILREDYSNDIIELYQNGISLRKIQEQLSNEAINKNYIPQTLYRYSRKAGEERKLLEVKTLFSISTIRDILKENNIALKNVGRRKSKSQTDNNIYEEIEKLEIKKREITNKIKILKGKLSEDNL